MPPARSAALLAAAVLLTAACGKAPATPAGRNAPALRLAYVFYPMNYEGGKPRPLYASNPADRPALDRIAAMLSAAEWSADPQVGPLPVTPPHGGITLIAVRSDGSTVQVGPAYRCTTQPDGSRTCEGVPNFVLVDGRPAVAPALARYLFEGGFKADMPPVRDITLVEPAPPQQGYARVRPGETIAVRGEGALEDPVVLLLMDDDAIGRPRRPEIALATLPAPAGAWAWRGPLPADLPPGHYSLCPGQRGGCQVALLVDAP